MVDTARLGALQRRILDHVHTPEPRSFMTAELADALLGSTDREAVRQVRRAVDALARRGLVETHTGAVEHDAPLDGETPPIGVRRYAREGRTYGRECIGDGCPECASGRTPELVHELHYDDGGRWHEYLVRGHLRMSTVTARLGRVRWVSLAWGVRSAEERLALLDRRIGKHETWLAEHSEPDARPGERPEFAVMRQWSWQRTTDALARDRALCAETLAELDRASRAE